MFRIATKLMFSFTSEMEVMPVALLGLLKKTFLGVFLILSACSIGSNYNSPQVRVPSKWSEFHHHQSSLHRCEVWWRQFHDPILNELIEHQAVYNISLQEANARVEVARSEYRVASAQLFPILSLDALPPNGTGVDLTQVLALNAIVTPDFFGKLRQNKQRAQANVEAAQANHDFVLLNLYAEIASSYLELREAQARDLIFHKNIKGNKQILLFLKSRYQTGLINYINIAQQEALVETQLGKLEQNKALIMMLLHKIERLTGKNPGRLASRLLPYKPIPQMNHSVNLGVPSELLRRRPDIIVAERRVAGAHANIRIALANLFPQINVGWLLGWQTQTLASNIFAVKNPESTFFGTFNAPIINLSLFRDVTFRKNEKRQAVLQYRDVVLNALHDVETQYNYCRHYKASLVHLKRAVAQKRLAVKLARNTYRKGLSDFNTVLLSEENLNQLEMNYLHNILIYQLARIDLYKALGGGVDEKQ